MRRGSTHTGDYHYIKAISPYYDSVDDVRETNGGGYIKQEKCTVANAIKGAGTWVESEKTIDIVTAEFSGTIDETNDKFTIWDNSLLKWIRFSFANLKSFMKTYFDGIYEPKKGTDDNYVTDAQLIVIGNTSGINTGDNATNSQYSGLAASKQDALGFTPENVANKKTTLTDSDTDYPTCKAVNTGLANVLTNPMTDAGDIIYGGTSGVPTRLPKGNDDLYLKMVGGLPAWAAGGAGGGTSLWTAIVGTRASNTTITVVGDQTAIFKKGMIVRWLESAVIKWGMVAIPSTYSSPNTTITIIGCVCASIDTDSFKYSSIIGVEQFQKDVAVAGTMAGAPLTNITREVYALEPMYVFGTDLQVGSAGTTGNFVIDINKNGTSMFTNKPTLASTVASSATPFTADTAMTLAIGDKVTWDLDNSQTTPPVNFYSQLYVVPQRYFTLT